MAKILKLKSNSVFRTVETRTSCLTKIKSIVTNTHADVYCTLYRAIYVLCTMSYTPAYVGPVIRKIVS